MNNDTKWEEEGAMLEVQGTKMAGNKQPPSNHSYKAIYAQSLMAGAVFILAAGSGMPIGFSAILLPQIQSENSTLPTSEEMGSWIASIHSAATPLGSILSGPVMESWGRRTTLRVCVLPFVLGWTCMALATNHIMIFIARVFAGFAVGLSAAPSQVLLGEVAEPRIRGIIVGAPFVSYSLGILLVYALGSALPWRTVAALGCILPLSALVSLCFLPESPHWLARMGRGQEALRALTWLRGGHVAEAKSELAALALRQQEEDAECLAARDKKGWNPLRSSPLFSRSVLKPLIIVNTFNVLQILSGTFTIIFYAVNVIEQAGGGGADDDPGEVKEELNAAVLTALVRTGVTAVACALLLLVGRRVLAISSGLSSATFVILLGCYIYVSPDPSPVPWFPAAAVLGYVACNTFGFFVLPGLMLGEMLPAKARGPAGGFSFTVINITLFVTTKLYPQASHILQPHGLFWFFGVATLVATLFVFLFVPETKGQSLMEIEDYFRGNNLLWITRKRNAKVSQDNCDKLMCDSEKV